MIDRLSVTPELLQKFHAMPTCGTRYYRFDAADDEWKIQYANDLSDEQKNSDNRGVGRSCEGNGHFGARILRVK